MGWFFSKGSRSNLIRELTESQSTDRADRRVVDYTVVGDVLWSVVCVTAKKAGALNLAPGESINCIRCDLLERGDGGWGYKPLDESMYPLYFSCPLRYLDMAPVQCAEWRERVRAYHNDGSSNH